MQVLRRLGPVADDDVELALRQRPLVVEVAGERLHHQACTRRFTAEALTAPARKDATMKSG